MTSRAFRNDQLALLYDELCKLTDSHKVLPMNSGVEAVETAIKYTRKWGYESKKVKEDRAQIIVCNNNFHGRTLAIVGFSTDPNARDSFGPFVPGFKFIPFGDTEELKLVITSDKVAFMVEPTQGEAGVIIPLEGYLKKVKQICTRNNILSYPDR
jgi:ornithine--oxo-acid transaminase